MFGFNTVSLDKKGRLAIPAKYRAHLIENEESKIVITKDPQYPSLLIYPGNLWKEISNSFEKLSGLNPKLRALQWNFLGNAHQIDFEVSERMNILFPQSLREYAHLKEKQKVILIGMGQKFELWSEKNWKVKESGKEIRGERIDIELPEEVRRIPF